MHEAEAEQGPAAAERQPRRSRISLLLTVAAVLISYFVGTKLPVQEAVNYVSPRLEWLQTRLSRAAHTVVFGIPPELPADPPSAPPPARTSRGCVLAFADIHGDLLQAKRVLHLVGATDENDEWTAGTCTLVQLGDLVDRGPDSIAVLKLFDKVTEQAAQAGGRVIKLMGNHEMESIQGDFKDISREELKRVGTEALQRATLKELMLAVPKHYRNMIETFFRGSEAERAGVAAWAAAMGPGSWLGDTMRDRQVAALVGEGQCSTLFVHAGFDNKILKILESLDEDKRLGLGPVETLNKAVADEVAKCDGTQACPTREADGRVKQLFGEVGPWWTRVFMQWSQPRAHKQATELLSAVLHKVGASQVVVGHSIQTSPTVACDEQLYMMDVGMCRLILGKLAAWTCIDGKVSIVQRP